MELDKNQIWVKKTDFPIALTPLFVQEPDWKMKQDSNDVIMQKTREHIES